MLTLSTIIICLCFLGLAVFILHSFQLKASSLTAERSIPLGSNSDDFDIQLSGEDEPHEWFLEEQQLRGLSIDKHIFTAPSTAFPIDDIQIKNQQDGQEAKPLSPPRHPAKSQYPLLGAYNQRCIELRQRIKAAGLSRAQVDEALLSLYRTAATAELLHGKHSEGKLSLSQLKAIPLELIDELAMPYSLIGYNQLSLLGKNDIKRMLSHWGKPTSHLCPRNFHRESWKYICRRFG